MATPMQSMCFTMWHFGEWKGTRHPRGFSSIIPHAYHVLHLGSSNEISWWVREEYVVLSRYNTQAESLTSHHYYELVILRYYRTGCPCQIMFGNQALAIETWAPVGIFHCRICPLCQFCKVCAYSALEWGSN
jgi:hypothetical protein